MQPTKVLHGTTGQDAKINEALARFPPTGEGSAEAKPAIEEVEPSHAAKHMQGNTEFTQQLYSFS